MVYYSIPIYSIHQSLTYETLSISNCVKYYCSHYRNPCSTACTHLISREKLIITDELFKLLQLHFQLLQIVGFESFEDGVVEETDGRVAEVDQDALHHVHAALGGLSVAICMNINTWTFLKDNLYVLWEYVEWILRMG